MILISNFRTSASENKPDDVDLNFNSHNYCFRKNKGKILWFSADRKVGVELKLQCSSNIEAGGCKLRNDVDQIALLTILKFNVKQHIKNRRFVSLWLRHIVLDLDQENYILLVVYDTSSQYILKS